MRLRPEEEVRRALVAWLTETLRVPPRLIGVEYPLCDQDPLNRKRADVVVWKPASAEGGLEPWLLAECKAPGVPLDGSVADQARGYAETIRAPYLLLTNGTRTRCFKAGERAFVEIPNLPAFR